MPQTHRNPTTEGFLLHKDTGGVCGEMQRLLSAHLACKNTNYINYRKISKINYICLDFSSQYSYFCIP